MGLAPEELLAGWCRYAAHRESTDVSGLTSLCRLVTGRVQGAKGGVVC